MFLDLAKSVQTEQLHEQLRYHADNMSKRLKKSADFSIESLREEVSKEVDQQEITAKLLFDIKSIDLRLVECISVEVFFAL